MIGKKKCKVEFVMENNGEGPLSEVIVDGARYIPQVQGASAPLVVRW